MADVLEIGQAFNVPYPFLRVTVNLYDEDGPYKAESWRPGTRPKLVTPDDSEEIADGVGLQVLTIVSVHKPGRFPPRVFYTQEWVAPDGKKFGKANKCRVTVASAFRRKVRGFAYPFEISPPQTQCVDPERNPAAAYEGCLCHIQ